MARAKSSQQSAEAYLDSILPMRPGTRVDPDAWLVDVDLIDPNPYQPRQHFNKAKLRSLAESMRSGGQIQPLLLRPNPEKAGRYQLIAGERRLRAAIEGGIRQLQAVVREISNYDAARLARRENDDREDLSAIEKAYSMITIGFLTMGKRPPAFGPLTEEQLKEFPYSAIAPEFGMTPRSIRRYVDLFTLDADSFEWMAPGDTEQTDNDGDSEIEPPTRSEKYGRALLSLQGKPELQDQLRQAIEAEKLTGEGALSRADVLLGKVTPGSLSGPGAPAGQTQGSGFDTAGSSNGTSTRSIELGVGDGSSSAGTAGSPQSSTPSKKPDVIEHNIKPATSLLANAVRELTGARVSGPYRIKAKAEIALLKSHLEKLEGIL